MCPQQYTQPTTVYGVGSTPITYHRKAALSTTVHAPPRFARSTVTPRCDGPHNASAVDNQQPAYRGALLRMTIGQNAGAVRHAPKPVHLAAHHHECGAQGLEAELRAAMHAHPQLLQHPLRQGEGVRRAQALLKRYKTQMMT